MPQVGQAQPALQNGQDNWLLATAKPIQPSSESVKIFFFWLIAGVGFYMSPTQLHKARPFSNVGKIRTHLVALLYWLLRYT